MVDANEVEQQVTTALAAGDRATAARAALGKYGAEIFGFLVSVLGRRDAVSAYRATAELVALEIEAGVLSWSISLWLYSLARRAAIQQAASSAGVPARLERSVAPPANPTPTQRRHTEKFRKAAARLRRELPLDQRMLVVLRVGRGLSWSELAVVELGARAPVQVRVSREKSISREFEALKIAVQRDAMMRGISRRK